MWIIAEDGHDHKRGWGGSKLWGFIPMGGREGPEVFSMQLIRNLAELAWIPQFALSIPDLEWKDSSDNSFVVRAYLGEDDIAVTFELNEDGEIVRASSKRKYDIPEGFVEAPWHYDFSDHQDYGGIHVPKRAIATYEKAEGDWEYFRCRISSLVSEM
jgi:hypothetical protein